MKRKICFVSLGSLPLLTSNENLKYMGGAELMQVLIGNELTKKGYNISFITYNEEGERRKNFKNINLIKTYSSSHHINYFKKATCLWEALNKANAYIYIQSGGVRGLVALYCFIKRRKYIKWIASDKNVLLEGIDNKTTMSTKITLYIDIKFANLIIAQNIFQKQIIEQKYHKKCIIIKNPIPIQNKKNFLQKKNKEKIVLWIGTIRPIKQPEIFLEIALRLPKFNFKMIGGKSESEPELYDKIQKKVKNIPNLDFVGFVPYNMINTFYEESSIFVNTSKAEGFPNTFLEAFINFLPVISLNVDPDEIICKNNIGLHSKTFQQIVKDIFSLLNNDNLRNEMSIRARKYVEENHDLKKITDQFEKLLISFET